MGTVITAAWVVAPVAVIVGCLLLLIKRGQPKTNFSTIA